jgi:hypothetical protein
MITESFSTTPLAEVAPSYLYFQYQDDDDLQAFVASYNEIAQGYIDWFNNVPFGLYTSPNISGALLDWFAVGIYGIHRPYLSSIKNRFYGATDTSPTDTLATNKFLKTQSGNSVIVNDDIYKRVLTWFLYRGDGYQVTVEWLRKRIARFVYGPNGSDITLDDAQMIDISLTNFPPTGSIGVTPINTFAVNSLAQSTNTATKVLEIKIPTSTASQYCQSLINNGTLVLPVELAFKVTLV